MSGTTIPFELDGSGFPINPRLGTLFIKDANLYARVRLGVTHTWYPIANSSSYYIQKQGPASPRWRVDHNLGMPVENLWAQAQDQEGNLLAGTLITIDTDSFYIDFAVPQAGTVIVVSPGALAVPTVVASQISIGHVLITENGVTISGSPVVTLADLGSGVSFITAAQMDARIHQVVGAAPQALDTLGEIATRIQSNESTAVALVGVVGQKANKADLAPVSLTGSYSDLVDKPVFPTALSQFTNDRAFISAPDAPVQTVFGRQGFVTLVAQDVETALGYVAYSSTNPAHYITAAQAPVQTVFGRSGAVALTSQDITAALGYAPYSAANPTGYMTAAQTDARIQQVVGAAPLALDTLEELATRMVGDESTVGSLILTVASKANIIHEHPISEVQGLMGMLLDKANTADLKTVAFTNNYTDLLNKPQSYVLPVATATAIGGVKPGNGIAISGDGTLSTTGVYGVSSVAGKTGTVVLAPADIVGLAPVGTTNKYSSLDGLPTIPTRTSQLVNDSAFLDALTPLVQSVGGRTGHVVLTVEDVERAVSTDSLGIPNGVATLDSGGQLLPSQIPAALTGGLQYQGVWDASTNTPTLSIGSGSKGQYYKVSVAGTTDLGGASEWTVGDLAVNSGSSWDQVQGGSSDVVSVFGRVGPVTLTTADIVAALGYTPYNDSNPANYLRVGYETMGSVFGRTGNVVMLASDVTTALGYTPYDSANPNDYRSGAQIAASIAAAAYVLPVASASNLGGVKVDGSTINISGGVISGLALGATPGVALAVEASIGVLGTAARSDHVHPYPTPAQIGALSGNQAITISGDATGSGTTAITLTLASVATAGTYGSATQVPGVTINAKGLVTGVSLNAITPAGIGAVATSAVGALNGVATLDASGRLTPAQIPSALVGALQYQGVWNATTNVPALASGVGIKGQYYKVSVAGTTSIDGFAKWTLGDLIVFDGSAWEQVQGGTSDVSSVFGRVGAVTLTSSDVTTALGFTPYDVTNPGGYITSAQAPVQSVFGRQGAVVLTSLDVTTALTFTPYDATNPSGYLTATGTIANSTNATYLSATQQTNTITGKSASMVMGISDTTPGSFTARATGSGNENLAGMSFFNDAYGIKLGVRADGYFGLGGWSRAAWSWYSDSSGNMVSAGNVTAYSDPRLKENFKRIQDPHWLLARLEGGTFNWKSGIPHTAVKAGKRDYGVLASQVEAVMPEIVTESIKLDGESYKTVDYTKLIPVLLEAIKDLNARVQALGG